LDGADGGGWAGVPDGVFAGFFDAVAVVAGSFDGAGAGAVPAGRVGFASDLGEDSGQGLVPGLRGKAAVPVAVRRIRRRARVKETRSGSRSAACAARVIRTLIG